MKATEGTNRNSVSLNDMALATSEAASVAANYRVSIENFSAMTGTIESATKLGGLEVGNGIKSILINLQNISSSKIVKTLSKANASMSEFVNGAEQLRDPISIIRDLAKTFNSLDEADPLRSEILTNIGGKYQANKLSALLSNMDTYDKMLKDYSEGTGSAIEEANKSANNWEGNLNKLSNSWTAFVQNFTNTDSIIKTISTLDNFIKILDGLTSALGALGTVGLGAGFYAGFKNAGIFKFDEETKKIKVFSNNISQLRNKLNEFNVNKIFNGYKSENLIPELNAITATNQLKKFNDFIKTSNSTTDEYFRTFSESPKYFKEYIYSTTEAERTTSNYTQYLKEARASQLRNGEAMQFAGIKANFLSTAMKGLSIVANMATGIITGMVITSVITFFADLANAQEKFKEKVEETKSKIQEQQKTLQEVTSTVDENIDRFVKLSDGVSKYSENLSLSTEDYSEYLSISNQIAEIAPSIVNGYDNQGNALLKLGDNAEETRKKIEKLKEVQQKKTNNELINGMDTLAQDASKNVKNAKNEKSILEEQLKIKENSLLFGSIGVDDLLTKGYLEYNDRNLSESMSIDKYKNALTKSGLDYTDSNGQLSILGRFSKEQLENAKQYYEEDIANTKTKIEDEIDTLKKDIAGYDSEISTAYDSLFPSIQAWTKNDVSYSKLPNQFQEFVDKIIPEINWEDKGYEGSQGYKDYIKKQILTPLRSLSGEDTNTFNSYLNKLFSFEDGDLKIIDFVEEFQSKLNELGIKIDVTPIIADEKDAKDRLYNSFQQISQNDQDAKVLENFTKNFTVSEVETWLQVTNGINGATEAIKAYKERVNLNSASLSLSDWLNASQSGEEGDSANSDLIDSYLEKVETLKGKLKDLSSLTTDDLYELSKSLDDMSFLDIDLKTPDGLEEFKQKVISLATDDFEDLKNSMSHIGDSVDKSNLLSYLEEASDLTKSLQGNINSATDEISVMENAFSPMNTAYQEFKDKDTKVVSQSSIDGMKETFGSLDYFEKFASTVGNVNSSATECQNSFNKLATEYMYANIQLGHLTKSNKDYYISQMQQMGIVNASEVVNSALNKTAESLTKTRKYAALSTEELSQVETELADAGHDLNKMSIEEIENFLESGNASDIASNSLTKYIAQKELSKATSINENTSISSLLTLANACGISTTAMVEYQKAKKRLESVNSATDEQLAGTNKALAEKMRQSSINAMKKASSDARKSILDEYKKINFSDIAVDYTGDTSSKSKSKDSKDKFSNSIDWASQSITKLTRDISDLEDSLSNTKGWNAQIKVIDKLISKNNELAKSYSKQSSTYKKVYLSAAKGLPANIKKGLKTGRKYNIQDFSSEKMYNKYNKAIEYYNSWQDALNNQRSTSRKTSKYKDDKLQVRIDQKNAQLEVKKSEYENLDKTIGKDGKNSNLNSQISLSKKYYSLLISQEKNAEGKAKLRAEREKEIASLVKNQYENLREYYNTLIDVNSAIGDYKTSIFDVKTAKGSDTAKDRIAEYNNQVSTANYNASKARADAKNILGTYSSGKNKGKVRKISDLSTDEQKDYYDTLAKAYEYDKEKYEAQYNAWYEKKIQPYENTISNVETKRDKANNNISLKEAQGKEATVSDYEEVRKTYKDSIKAREKENKLYEERLKYAEANYGKTSSMYIETKKLIDENTDAIAQERIEQENLNKTIQEYPINKLKEALEVLESTTSAYEALLSLRDVQGKNKSIEEIQTQIENNDTKIANLEEQKKNAQDLLDKAIVNGNEKDIDKWKKEFNDLSAELLNSKADNEKLLDEIFNIRIKALEEEKEAIQKVTDAQDRRLKLENAQYELEKALTQKTKRTIKDGQMVYTTDDETIKNAQENLIDVQNEEIVNKMDDIIETLESMKDDFNIYDADGNLQKDENGNEITIEQALKTAGLNADEVIETLKGSGIDVDKFFKDMFGEKQNDEINTSKILIDDNWVKLRSSENSIKLGDGSLDKFDLGLSALYTNPINSFIANQEKMLSNLSIPTEKGIGGTKIEIGKIEMHEVSDVNAFAKELKNAIPTTFAQVFNSK